MKQNKNKNITKITSSALVLLLSSGGIFSNSLAKDINSKNTEKVIVEKKDELDKESKEKIENCEKENENENLDKKTKEETEKTNKNDFSNNPTITDVVDNLDNQTNESIEEKESGEKKLYEDEQYSEDKETLNLNANEEKNIDEENKYKEKSLDNINSENLNEDKTDDQNKESNDEVSNAKIKCDPEIIENENPKYINEYENKEEFVKMLASHSSLAKEYNIFPEVMMGQAILESGWGKSDLAKNNKNLFGVKVPDSEKGQGKGVVYKTNEEIKGKNIIIKDEFRKFDTYEQSIRQYLSLLSGKYYSSFGVNTAKNYKEQIQRIKDAGYATASNYVDSVLNVIDSANLSEIANKYLASNVLKKTHANTAKKRSDKKENRKIVMHYQAEIIKDRSTQDNLYNTTSQKEIFYKHNLKKENRKLKISTSLKTSKKTDSSKLFSENLIKEGLDKSKENNLFSKNNKDVTIYKDKNYRKNQKSKIVTNNYYNKIESDNVKTGVSSLSSVLLTIISTSSLTLFASKKKNK